MHNPKRMEMHHLVGAERNVKFQHDRASHLGVIVSGTILTPLAQHVARAMAMARMYRRWSDARWGDGAA